MFFQTLFCFESAQNVSYVLNQYCISTSRKSTIKIWYSKLLENWVWVRYYRALYFLYRFLFRFLKKNMKMKKQLFIESSTIYNLNFSLLESYVFADLKKYTGSKENYIFVLRYYQSWLFLWLRVLIKNTIRWREFSIFWNIAFFDFIRAPQKAK